MNILASKGNSFFITSKFALKRVTKHLERGYIYITWACIARQMGHCMGVNFNIHIWAWSASPSVQVGDL